MHMQLTSRLKRVSFFRNVDEEAIIQELRPEKIDTRLLFISLNTLF